MQHTSNIPEHWVFSTVGHSRRICVTVAPQVGPVPGHFDDVRASLPSDFGNPPIVHCHGAEHKQPSQRWNQEARYLDQTFSHCGNQEANAGLMDCADLRRRKSIDVYSGSLTVTTALDSSKMWPGCPFNYVISVMCWWGLCTTSCCVYCKLFGSYLLL